MLALYLSYLVIPIIESASTASNGSAIALINNNLNLYSVLIDTKNLQALDQVFTPDASPIGLAAPPGEYPNNLAGIRLYLRDALDDAITLHYSDTQVVGVGPTGDTATAISYGQAVYFAKDVNVTGQIATVYTTITDDLVLVGDQWLSRNKTLGVTVS